MSFPDIENSIGKTQMQEVQEAELDRLRTIVYHELLGQAQERVTHYTGFTKLSRDKRVKLEDAQSTLKLLKGIEKLKFLSGSHITGELAQDETFITQTHDDKLEKKAFPKGTPVNITFPTGEQKNFTGNVGSTTSEITLQGLVNKYGRVLRKIDRSARERTAVKPI